MEDIMNEILNYKEWKSKHSKMNELDLKLMYLNKKYCRNSNCNHIYNNTFAVVKTENVKVCRCTICNSLISKDRAEKLSNQCLFKH